MQQTHLHTQLHTHNDTWLAIPDIVASRPKSHKK